MQEKSWMLYDWANSIYVAVVMTTLLPIFFKSVTADYGLSNSVADSYWGYATSAATLLISLFAPLLGALGDYSNMKMKIFKTFFYLGVFATGMLFFSSSWRYIIVFYMISLVGYLGANLFYDALIVDVSSSDRMDKVSTYGYAVGYLGGSLLPLAAVILFLLRGDDFSSDLNPAIKISFLATSAWWFVFTIPMLKNVRQVYSKEKEPHLVRSSFGTLYRTIKNISSYRSVFLFLVAYFFYIDGVNTIIHMAIIYGTTMGISNLTLIGALLVTQVVTIPCTLISGVLAKRFGSDRIILSGIAVYIVVCILAYNLQTDFDFWVITVLVGTSQGGLQALSRSYFGKMIPKESSNEFFGFYDILGKFAAIMGPALYGLFSQITGKSQYGVLSILILFVVGGAVFLYASSYEKRRSRQSV
ncbi:MFS transporter [Andreesenia angusta]|nr:MFS transporter [Andreesenia angusta]